MSRQLTVEQLIDAGLPEDTIDEFRQKFGDAISVDAAWIEAHSDELDPDSLAAVLPVELRELYAASAEVARMAQTRAIAEAQRQYDAVVGPRARILQFVLAQLFGRLYQDAGEPVPPPEEPSP